MGDQMNKYILYFLLYILIINIFGIAIMKYDKIQAIHNNYRISEKNLFIIAILLGSIGILIGMYAFRHKTKHVKFIIGIPISILINIVTIYYIISHVLLNI